MKAKRILSMALILGTIFLSACRTAGHRTSEKVPIDVPTVTTTSTSRDSGATVAGTTASLPTGKRTVATPASIHPVVTGTTAPPSVPAQTVYPFRVAWEDISAKDKKLIEACGIRKEHVMVDKSQMIYDKEWSLTEKYPAYSKYTKGDNRYYFQSTDGTLTGIAWYQYNGFDPDIQKTEAQLKKTADAIVNAMVDIRQYTHYEYSKNEETGGHTFCYGRMVGGYRTQEQITLYFQKNGLIWLVNMTKIGLFDGFTPPDISLDEIDAQCENELKSRYPDLQSFTVLARRLDIKDGQLLAYYKRYPEIPDGQATMIVDCSLTMVSGAHGKTFVMVPIGEKQPISTKTVQQ